jgi:hypothetical protein
LRQHFAAHGFERAADLPLQDFGILGLVVRAQGTLHGPVVAQLAHWNSWTWRWGNHYY